MNLVLFTISKDGIRAHDRAVIEINVISITKKVHILQNVFVHLFNGQSILFQICWKESEKQIFVIYLIYGRLEFYFYQ